MGVAAKTAGRVKVRIAVVVDSSGHWGAAGWSGASEDDMLDAAQGSLDGDGRVSWVTAWVPRPEPASDVAGEVSDALREALGHGADEAAWPPGTTPIEAVARLRVAHHAARRVSDAWAAVTSTDSFDADKEHDDAHAALAVLLGKEPR